MANVEVEFHYEYEEELETLRRKRFDVWIVAWGMYWLVVAIAGGGWITGLTGVAASSAGWWLRRRRFAGERGAPLRIAFWMLVATAAVTVVMRVSGPFGAANEGGLWLLLFSFFISAVFLPWTLIQSLQAALALWIVWLLGRAMSAGFTFSLETLLTASIGALSFGPGVVWRILSQSRFGRRFEAKALERYYDAFNRELFDAQKVHAAIFPKPRREGPVRFDYRDNPRLGIGGDYVHATYTPSGALNLVLLDVAGDGIPAALTVNRLHGELERLFAEDPDRAPDIIISALNRYVCLTLAPFGVYAVAMAFRIEPDGRLIWSGAGHAPAHIRRSTGDVERLLSTTWTLGASDRADELHGAEHSRLGPEDVLIAYTDGACDEQNDRGEFLRYDGMEQIVRGPGPEDPLHWPQRILSAVEQYRTEEVSEGRDVLVVAVTTPEATAGDAPAPVEEDQSVTIETP